MYVTATNEVVQLLGGAEFPRCESPSLRLEKFVTIRKAGKGSEISRVVATHEKYAKRIPQFTPPRAHSFHAMLGGRLIVNQAGGILENSGLCLHHHFGDPYIPGSAVKGITRHAAWCEWRSADEPEKALIADKIIKIFGYPTGDKNNDGLDDYIEPEQKKRKALAGNIAFLAAIPVQSPNLVLDIVNCHHPQYYAGKSNVASDDEQPNPQNFIAVESGSEWRFTLVPSRRLDSNAKELLQQAEKWLVDAIAQHGAGAKTAAGYGWFIYDAEKNEARLKQEADNQVYSQLQQEFDVWASSVLGEIDSIDSDVLAEYLDKAKRTMASFKERYAVLKRSLPNEQQFNDAVNRNSRRLPQQSPEDKLRDHWQSSSVKAVINGDIKRFARHSADRQLAIVRLLRSSEGVGADVWRELKTGNPKGDIAKAVQQIHSYSKANPELGRMP